MLANRAEQSHHGRRPSDRYSLVDLGSPRDRLAGIDPSAICREFAVVRDFAGEASRASVIAESGAVMACVGALPRALAGRAPILRC